SKRLSPMDAPWAARNVKHMPPPISSWSATPSNASMTLSLSLTLEPPRMATNGRRGSVRRPSSPSTPRASGPRGAGRGEELGRPHDGGVRPVRGAEGVVDVRVEAGDQPGHEGGIVGL